MNKESNETEKPSGPVENAWSYSMPSFNKGDMKHTLQEESKFEVAYPTYRGQYLKECWPGIEKIFKEHGIKGEINLMEGIMSVATTRKTWDPFLILKARDVIKLLGRSVNAEHAIKVIADDVTCEIIKIKGLVRNKAVLCKRRERLIGSNGSALKALELLTNCYILVQGCTVCAIGSHKGVQQVVRVVKSTMKNIHPVNLMKVLMIQRSLANDPDKKNEDWSKYIPTFVKTNVQRKKPKKIRVKKPYTPFPPEREECKKDKNLSTGQYFVDKELKEREQSDSTDKSKDRKPFRNSKTRDSSSEFSYKKAKFRGKKFNK